MRVSVVPAWRTGQWQVRLTQGVQSFNIDTDSSKAHAEWMAKMLRKAVKANNEEVVVTYLRRRNGKI